MSKGSPTNIIHLLERMSEPLGFGLRGGGGGEGDSQIYYYYDNTSTMETMLDNDSMKNTVTMVRRRMGQERNVQMVPLPPRPKIMPDLNLINKLCPKDVTFCYFLPTHRKAFAVLREAFRMQGSVDEVYQMACACRDSPMMNPNLFVYSYCSALVSRPDTAHIQIPSHVEISPDNYCGADVVRQANKMAHMPVMSSSEKRPPIMIDKNVTGRGNDPEQRMWYFREDILVNSHHSHWHIVFPACSEKDPSKPGYRDRRGELFYYMHHSMVARYDTERLCNGLARTKIIDFGNPIVEEGYFSKLSSENSGQPWGSRQARTPISSVHNRIFNFRIEDLTRWRDRILESIDLGYCVMKDPVTGKEGRFPLDEFKGIDVLGDLLENSTSLTPHLQYYGNFGFHNLGHVLIASSHDPLGKFKEGLGPMGDVSTAMRDPAFYRWHKYIDNIFDIYKKTLPPYPLDPDGKSKFHLRWKGVEVVPQSFYVKAYDSNERNSLKTNWDYVNIDLSRGLDFRRNINEGTKLDPVIGRFTHLNHSPFDYFMKIENKLGRPVRGTVRIFMAPRHDEHGDVFDLQEQRLLFFEMDKQSVVLKPGVNDVQIRSADSSVTLRDEAGSSFKRLEEIIKNAKTKEDVVKQSQCSCGWPQHLLLPRGSGGGTEYDLFVIVTDGAIDMVPDVDRKVGCNSALSFCGVLNQKYPDARPMGYPFDRLPYSMVFMGEQDIQNQCPDAFITETSLDSYCANIKNSEKVVVKIFHSNVMAKEKTEGVEGEQVIRPDGKCVRLRDYYSVDGKQNGGGGGGENRGSNKSGGGSRPNSLNREEGGRGINFGGGRGGYGQQTLQYPSSSPSGGYRGEFSQQQQWGGAGSNRGGGGYRRGRDYDPDEEWEHVAGV